MHVMAASDADITVGKKGINEIEEKLMQMSGNHSSLFCLSKYCEIDIKLGNSLS